MNELKADNPEPRKESKVVLYIVDDEAMLLELASIILEPLGCEIHTFRDPQAALQAFTAAQPRPALVITDYAMHSMNGMDLIVGCRKLEPAQKILLLSGTIGPEIFDGAPCQPDAFLSKPYHAKQLIDLVKAMLAR
jgi:CheY-like chemotaxis protein